MSYKHFTRDDRVRLAVLLKTGAKVDEIGRTLKKDVASIRREVRRNSVSGRYSPYRANKAAKDRRTHRRKKIESNQKLRRYILQKLKLYWSPEQIAGRLRRDKIVIAHETIYEYIIRNKKLKKYLRCQKGKYRRRHGTVPREKAREYEKKRWIGERPEIINQRHRIGDWEGDTVIGGEKTKRILTHVERVTCYLVADILPVVSAEIVSQKTIESFKRIPRQKRKSITYDNGTEFATHEIIERETGAVVYFANKYHSWERGTNENTNGLIRQFFPKRSSFAKVTQEDVDRVAKLLNRRPRKKLNYLTPYEMFKCTSF